MRPRTCSAVALDGRAVGSPRCWAFSEGYSVLELLFVVGLATTITATAVPQMTTALENARATSATRYVSARLHRARMEAMSHSADVGIQFTTTGSGFDFATYLDGNGNGIRTQDITKGVDSPIVARQSLGELFRGVDFGTLPNLPAIDPQSPPPGSDPIKLGAGDIVTFSPAGTSTSGTLYILGARRAQYAVRVFGETGRIRTLKFDRHAWRWNADE